MRNPPVCCCMRLIYTYLHSSSQWLNQGGGDKPKIVKRHMLREKEIEEEKEYSKMLKFTATIIS